MLRYDRSRYIALGLPSLLNAALLVYALGIKTTSWPDGYSDRFYLVLAGLLGLLGATAMIKRARDIGSSAWGILLGFMFAPPLMLLIALVLIFVPSNPSANLLDPPPSPPGFKTWLTGLTLLISPWIAVLLLKTL